MLQSILLYKCIGRSMLQKLPFLKDIAFNISKAGVSRKDAKAQRNTNILSATERLCVKLILKLKPRSDKISSAAIALLLESIAYRQFTGPARAAGFQT